jgi:hypothetical protein
MLTPLDDTLWHQIPTTFDHVGTSDPRFFDRYWFACYSRDRDAALQMTMGAYRNMNVFDGGAILVIDGKQYNIRASRSLDRSADSTCGPLQVAPTVPLRELKLTIAPGDHHICGEIVWRAIEAAHEEHPHFQRLRGRVVQDYRRFTQIGIASGWIEAAGKRLEIEDWWACRDHSWGVRQGMGIREPITGPKASLSEKGHVHAFLYFSTEKYSGAVQLVRRGDDEPYTTGVVTDRTTGTEHEVVDLTLELEFYPGTRRFRTALLDVTFADAERLRLESEAFGSSIVMTGLGYSGGYRDGAGTGAWRGEFHLESDVWDVSDPARVVYEDGQTAEPWHRVQPVRVTADDGSRSMGMGSMTLTVSGRLPKYLGGE